MIMKCRVLLNNEAVTVVKYDDIEIQLPAINREADEITVLLDNGGHYSVVDDNYIEESIEGEKPVAKPKKKATKKTTIDESAIKEDDLVADDEE